MKILFIGGTGIISAACTELAARRGYEVTLLSRGQHVMPLPAGVKTLVADVNDPALGRRLGQERFDAVVDWVAFTPADIERDLQLFRGRTRQFLFISSASAYQKPQTHYLMTESTPLANPHWDYSRNKIACEERLLQAYRDEGFPATIVRPSLTYGATQIPLVLNSWARPWTAVDRMLRGRKLVVPGDGTSLWVVTHNSDFAKGLVGLLGHAQSIGQAFHITSDEVLTWDQMFRIVGAAVGIEPQLVHIPSDFIVACVPEKRGTLLGDKSVSVVFDNSKIKRFVPGYCATTSFAEGIGQAVTWFDADASRKEIDEPVNAMTDRMIAAYEKGLEDAARSFR
jgi:nucleoside-diphosphate-sugar epimerase